MKLKIFLTFVTILSVAFLVGCSGSTFAPEFRVMDIVAIRASDLSWEEELEFEKANASFFRTVEREHGAFIMDLENFRVFGGQIQWEAHRQHYLSGEFDHFWPTEFCSYGHSIGVTANYFLHNPIEPISGGNLLDYFAFEPYTMNILVPESLREYEADIITAYQQRFWFDKINVENIYHEFIGTSINETTQEELNINIIYVKDSQTYFTFDSSIEPENDNLITDPIVRVLLPDNIHSAQYRPMTQRGIFLYGIEWKVQDFDTGRDDLVVNAIRTVR
jgi:hypothetical protein